MTPEEKLVQQTLKPITAFIKDQLPSKDWGFIFLAFKFGALGNMIYAANAARDDVVQALREFIAKSTPKNYDSDVGETDADRIFERWWNKEIARLPKDSSFSGPVVRQLAFDAFMAGMVWSIES